MVAQDQHNANSPRSFPRHLTQGYGNFVIASQDQSCLSRKDMSLAPARQTDLLFWAQFSSSCLFLAKTAHSAGNVQQFDHLITEPQFPDYRLFRVGNIIKSSF